MPTQWVLVCVLLGPLFRRLVAYHMLATARLHAYADDVAVVLARLRSATAPLCPLRRWVAVSGLALETQQCVLLQLWRGDFDSIRIVLDGEGWLPGAKVAQAARDLGVTVGTNTRVGQWCEVAANIAAPSRDVASRGASWPTRLRLFTLHITS